MYRATGRYAEALQCTDSIAALKEALTNTEKTKAVNQLEIKYNSAEKDRQLVANELLIAQQKARITRKNSAIASVVAGICVIALVSVVAYRNARHRQRLQAQQISALQQQGTIASLKAMIDGEEKERSRIARELHDGIGGMLSAAMMRITSMKRDDAQANTEAVGLLNDIGDELRKTAHNLAPEVLMKQTLPEALQGYIQQLQQGRDTQLSLQCYGAITDIKPGVKLNVYRIVQELLSNIIQHAAANNALVQLTLNGHLFTITVEDDGKGFDTARAGDGMGLYNLQARVQSMSGSYTVESAPGKGTSVYKEFDLEQETTKAV